MILFKFEFAKQKWNNKDMGAVHPQLHDLILALEQRGVLKNQIIKDALLKVNRYDFVLDKYKEFAYTDEALPIGFGQTISQPYTVVFMLELLDVKARYKILEIGYGSCWQTALLAEIVGEGGHIYAMELVPELCEFGKNNIRKYPELKKRVSFYCRNAKNGLPTIAKNIGGFDRIISAASVETAPTSWKKQLKIGGILVYPSRNSIYKEVKEDRHKFKIKEYPGFSFVPFVE